MLQELTAAPNDGPTALLVGFFWVSAAACVVAQYFIVRAVVRAVPSETGSPDVPSPNKAMEITWAMLPALLMIAVFVGAWRHIHPTPRVDMVPTVFRGAAPALTSRS